MNIEQEIKNIELQLEVLKQKQAEANKPEVKTGQVLLLNDLTEREIYYYVGAFSKDSVQRTFFDNTLSDVAAFNSGNMFHDKETAKKELERNQLMQRMRIAANEDGGVDWGDENVKYSPKWVTTTDIFAFACSTTIRFSQLPHFKYRGRLQDFMNSLSPKQQKLLICGVD